MLDRVGFVRALSLVLLAVFACVSDDAVTPGRRSLEDAGSVLGPDARTLEGDAALAADVLAQVDGSLRPDASDASSALDATACTTCGASCVDTGSSAQHCGACDHDCGGGACDAGVCQPFAAVRIATCPTAVGVSSMGELFWTEKCSTVSSSTAVRRCAAPPCAVGAVIYKGIYGGPNGSIPDGLVVHKNGGMESVFYTDNQGPTYNTLWRLRFDGTLSENWGLLNPNPAGPGPVAAEGDTIVWGTNQGIYRASATMPGSTQFAATNGVFSGKLDEPPIGNLAIDANSIYIGAEKGVYVCDRATACSGTTAPRLLSENIGMPTAIAVDGDDVYVVNGDTKVVTGTESERVLKVSKGLAVQLVEVGDAIAGATHAQILVDAKYLYWSSLSGAVLACPKTDCSSKTLLKLASGVSPFGLAQDANFVYFAGRAKGVIGAVRKPL
jgi:hypothetical protein